MEDLQPSCLEIQTQWLAQWQKMGFFLSVGDQAASKIVQMDTHGFLLIRDQLSKIL